MTMEPQSEAPGLVPMAAPRRWAAWALVGLIVAAGGTFAVRHWWPSTPPPPVVAEMGSDDDLRVSAPPNPGYLGPQACAPCHAARVAAFLKTNHARACRVARPGEMPVGFAPRRGTLVTRVPGLRFEMSQVGDEFRQTTIRATPAGEQRTVSRIDLAYGAGGLDEVYFTWRGDRLFELPMAWLHPLSCWGATPFSPNGTGDFSRDTTTRCLECHNTWFGHVPGTTNEYDRPGIILGVTCERCHGPGQEHVAYHQAHPHDETAHAIVHPGKLPRERRLEVCTQCHSNANKDRGPAFRYRPGEVLADYFRTGEGKYPETEHVANQIEYLRQSQCFLKSEMTCDTCHDPHRPHGPVDTAAVRQACAQCHQSKDCAEQPRLPAAVRANCTGCHMPARVWVNVHFHTADDQYVPPIRRHNHRIAIDLVARNEVLLAWYRTQPDDHSQQEAARLTKALVGHWLAEAESRRRAYRFLAASGAVREALRLDPSPAVREKLRQIVAMQAHIDADFAQALRRLDERRFPEARRSLEGVLQLNPNHAAAHGRLGTVYAATGQTERAVRELQAAARCDPDDPYGESMLGWLAYLQGQWEDAVAADRRADAIEPFTAKIQYHLGLALAKLGRWPEAESSFRQVLTIDPRHAGGCQGLSYALRRQGQAEEALIFARRAARLSHSENADVLITLVDALADLGRFAEAQQAAEQALKAAQVNSPEMVPLVRRRLEEVRQRAGKSAR